MLLWAAVVVSAISVALRLSTYRQVHAALYRLTPEPGPVPAAAQASDRVLEIARVVGIASRHTLVSNTCLHRSLALWWLLRRRGFDSRVRFGARKHDGTFEAHAWVEHAGAIVNDNEATEGGYVPLPPMPLNNGA